MPAVRRPTATSKRSTRRSSTNAGARLRALHPPARHLSAHLGVSPVRIMRRETYKGVTNHTTVTPAALLCLSRYANTHSIHRDHVPPGRRVRVRCGRREAVVVGDRLREGGRPRRRRVDGHARKWRGGATAIDSDPGTGVVDYVIRPAPGVEAPAHSRVMPHAGHAVRVHDAPGGRHVRCRLRRSGR